MTEVSADQLKQAIEDQHGGRATLVAAEPVKETFDGKTVWEGTVYVFDLAGCQGVCVVKHDALQ
jgi:hypothetical protein